MKPIICTLCLVFIAVACRAMTAITVPPPSEKTDSLTYLKSVKKAEKAAARAEFKAWKQADKSNPNLLAQHSPYKFKAENLVIPTLMIGIGLVSISDDWWTVNVNEPVKQAVHTNIFTGKYRFDDYIQYLPMASVYGLKLCGVKSRHDYIDATILLATSYAIMGITVNGIKYSARKLRPDGSSRNSFPSGHTATTFMGAELVRMEFWDTSPWIGVGAYAVAFTTGFMRMYNNRHWFTDVLAGAGIGILSVQAAYWLYPYICRHIFPRRYRNKIAVTPYATAYSQGIGFRYTF